MKKGRYSKKIISVAVSVMMAISMFPMTSFAYEPIPVVIDTDTESINNVVDSDSDDIYSNEGTDESTGVPNESNENNSVTGDLYVSSLGDDNNTGIDEEHAVSSLAKAINIANGMGQKDDITIVILDNITSTETARITDKNITIEGNGYTISRGDGFKTISDTSRSWYNPAMIEVTTPNEKGAKLTLKNITLDDKGKHEGSIFEKQKQDAEKDNEERVQDAIVAAYGTSKATAEIVLGDGAILKDFGGMSAIRVTGGATATMMDGSEIYDDVVGDRKKSNGSGISGAVWVEGTEFYMERNSKIRNISGRGIFLETNAKAEINGTIEQIKNAEGMRNSGNGVAIYIYGDSRIGNSEATLGKDGCIKNISGKEADYCSAITIQYGKFTSEQGSVISEVNDTAAIYPNDSFHKDGNGVYIKGVIEDCEAGYIVRPRLSDFTLEETGVIRNCKGTSILGAILYSTDAANYNIKGTVTENNSISGKIFFILKHQDKASNMVIEPTAKITGNNGSAVHVTNGSHIVMNGGEISNNGTGVKVEGKDNIKNTSFIMNGGSILNNRTGISYTIAGESKVELNAGTIQDNGTSYQISATGGSAKDANEYIKISEGVLKENTSVSTSFGTITLDSDYENLSLGKLSDTSEEALLSKVTNSGTGRKDWAQIGSYALWIKPESDNYHFKLNKKITNGKGIYVAYMPVKEDGTLDENAKVTVKRLENEENLDITLDGAKAGTPYAVMLVNSDVYCLSAEDISIYTGGDDYTNHHGLPEDFTLNEIEKIERLKIGEDAEETVGSSDEEQAEAIEKIKEALNVQYKDGNSVLANDSKAGDYDIVLSEKEDITINGNDVEFENGDLIVRYVQDKSNAINLDNALLSNEPTEMVEEPTAVITGTSGEYYTNNDTSRKVTDTSGISLLYDSLLSGRQDAMEKRGDQYVKWTNSSQNMENKYKFYYLDLVDYNNGNAWVSSKDDVDIYLPYPEGTDKNTELQVIHYKDLHREYGINGQENIEQAIKDSELESMVIEKTDKGIKFSVSQSGFSPFAIVWQGKKDDGGSSSGGGSGSYQESDIIGKDRYETAGLIADRIGYYDSVILVNANDTLADGLSAASLSGKENAPILLVKKDKIPEYTKKRIEKASTVYIIGEKDAISKEVENQLKDKKVIRIGGKNRVETSLKLAEYVGNYDKAFIVNGYTGEADAMSASAASAKYKAPIILTNGKTSNYAKKSGVEYYAVGGKAVLDDKIVSKYGAERFGGDDRYETNRLIINEFYKNSSKYYFTKGDPLVDALTVSLHAKDNGVVLVSKKSDNSILKGKDIVQVGGMPFSIFPIK